MDDFVLLLYVILYLLGENHFSMIRHIENIVILEGEIYLVVWGLHVLMIWWKTKIQNQGYHYVTGDTVFWIDDERKSNR